MSLAALILFVPSCENEKDIQRLDLGTNTLAFKAKGVQTRSDLNRKIKGAILSFGTDDFGNQLVLEETIETLNYDFTPMTKGTPAFTDNLTTVFGGSFNAIGYNMEGKNVLGDASFRWSDETKVWSHDYGQDPWKDCSDENKTLYFFARMPENPTGASNWIYNVNEGECGSISFDYVTPETASAQQDILFSSRALKKSEYDKTKGADLLFHHALTGVKFALGNTNSTNPEGTRTFITNVKFTNLVKEAKCTVTPVQENGGYTDVEDVYSSANASVWDFENSKIGNFEQSFEKETLVNLTGKNLEKGGAQNINDENASMTFWFIPQVVDQNVKLSVTFYVQRGNDDGEEITREIEFGKLVNGVEWKAGQLRTYTLKPNDVGIDIDDKITETTKTNVKVTNTGNVAQYVRATIIANWVGSVDGEEQVVLGYTSATDDTFLEPWALNTNGTGANYGTFTSLPKSGWVYNAKDGFYYYTTAIGIDQAATNTLFDSYEVTDTPKVWRLNPETLTREEITGIHLVMDIAVQAIEAKFNPSTGETLTYKDCWEECGAEF